MQDTREVIGINLKLEDAVQPRLEKQQFLLSGVTWEQYETLRTTLDNFPGLRMTMLELFMPSEEHEEIETTIARLLELYAIERNIRL